MTSSNKARRRDFILEWLEVHGRMIFLSVDCLLGVIAGVIVFLALEKRTPPDILATAFFIPALAVGGTVAGLCASLLSGFNSLAEGHYRRVLQQTRGGIDAALFPYKVVGGLALSLACLALISLLFWNLPPPNWIPTNVGFARRIVVSVVAALALWTLIGTAQLIMLNVFHSTQKNKVFESIDEAERIGRGKSNDSSTA